MKGFGVANEAWQAWVPDALTATMDEGIRPAKDCMAHQVSTAATI